MKTLAKVGRTVSIYKDRFIYSMSPSITILDSGEWLVAFNVTRRRERIMHPPSDPLFRTLLTRTSDGGDTWEEPYFAPDYDWYGLQCPGISQLSNGTVVLPQFRYGWYPLGLARKRRAAGEPIAINLPKPLRQRQVRTEPHRAHQDWGIGFYSGVWTEDFTDDDWDRSQLSWARGYHGLYVHLSTDKGYTFDTIKIDCSPYHDGVNRIGVTELQDGRVAYPVAEASLGRTHLSEHIYILFSSTGGKSWDPPILIVEAESPDLPFNEPHIAEVAPGEIYCILRTAQWSGYLYGCRSLDGGHNWSMPEATPMFGYPGHLLVLQDGRLLCTYGRRVKPFGIRACLSEDGGRTWEIDQEIVIRDLPNSDLGYPTTIEYAPGQLFVCYWGEEPDGVACIQGTYVTLT